MKRLRMLTGLLGILSISLGSHAMACGGGGSTNANSSFAQNSSSSGYDRSAYPSQNPLYAMSQSMSQIASTRQAINSRTAAYNTRMQTLRIARGAAARKASLAARESRKEIRIAKLNSEEISTGSTRQLFLSKARTWVDHTGQHRMKAVLVAANSWGVKLQREDGSTVNVPMSRLSSPDQSWVVSNMADKAESTVMLAGL